MGQHIYPTMGYIRPLALRSCRKHNYPISPRVFLGRSARKGQNGQDSCVAPGVLPSVSPHNGTSGALRRETSALSYFPALRPPLPAEDALTDTIAVRPW